MMTRSGLKLRESLQRLVRSIAFYPALIGVSFLALSYISIRFDFSEAGKQIKSQLSWLSLRDASTARSIISAIVSGVISLTVFSFSMVMIVLNQAASQMSNRVLDKLIGNRFQQIVLGIYIGTIVYALFLLSTIRDIDSGIYVPALSTYLLIVLTVLDIFLFIYFLHYITQSVKYEVIIERIYDATKTALKQTCCLQEEPAPEVLPELPYPVAATASGTYEGVDAKQLLALCQEAGCSISIAPTVGTFVLEGIPIAFCDKPLPEDLRKAVLACVRIEKMESIANNYFYGFKQLMEIALKALSPGINDPDTAVLSLRALFRLYLRRARSAPQIAFKQDGGDAIVAVPQRSFDQVFEDTLRPVWDYGRKDRIIRTQLLLLLEQFQATAPKPIAATYIRELKAESARRDDEKG